MMCMGMYPYSPYSICIGIRTSRSICIGAGVGTCIGLRERVGGTGIGTGLAQTPDSARQKAQHLAVDGFKFE